MKSAFAAVLALTLLFGIYGCGGSHSGPSGTVTKFIKAMQEGDIDTAWQLTPPNVRTNFMNSLGGVDEAEAKTVLKQGGAKARQSLRHWKVGEVEQNGNNATAVVTVYTTENPEGVMQTVKLIKQGDRWFIDFRPDNST